MTPRTDPDVTAWLDEFVSCVRTRDTTRARALFADDTLAFGTRVEVAPTLDVLVEQQWAPVWEATTDFTVDPGSVGTSQAHDRTLVVVHALWSSVGSELRSGRCTFVLRRAPGPHGLVAVHSHFSLTPTDPAL